MWVGENLWCPTPFPGIVPWIHGPRLLAGQDTYLESISLVSLPVCSWGKEQEASSPSVQPFHGLGALGVGVRLLWAGQGVSSVSLCVSEQCEHRQSVAFKQLFGPSPYPIHPRGARRPRLSLPLGKPGANAPLVSSPPALAKRPP